MNRFVIGVLILCSLNVHANHKLQRHFIIAQSLYSLGGGGSYIQHARMSLTEFNSQMNKRSMAPVASKDELISALKECVMIKEGTCADYPHLSSLHQETITKTYAHILLKQSRFSYIRIKAKQSIPELIDTAPCGLAIRLDDDVLIMRGSVTY